MKKAIGIIVCIVMCIDVLAGCSKHEHTWIPATCTQPLTCSTCGEISGSALGHTWKEATCEEPMTCAICGETQGEANGHRWSEVSCASPSTCEICGLTSGESLEHELNDYGKCTVCGEQVGVEITLDNFSKYFNVTFRQQHADKSHDELVYVTTTPKINISGGEVYFKFNFLDSKGKVLGSVRSGSTNYGSGFYYDSYVANGAYENSLVGTAGTVSGIKITSVEYGYVIE